MQKPKKQETPDKRARRAALTQAVNAFDAMCSSRPLTPPPPPANAAEPTVSAGAAALAKEKRLGVYKDVQAELNWFSGVGEEPSRSYRSMAVRV